LLKEQQLEVLVTIGDKDILIEKTRDYVAALRDMGVPVWLEEIEGMEHNLATSDHVEQRVRATVAFMHHSALSLPASNESN
jgi:dipeptidyl aminopeptidase/acylaminoacyl peptidase